MTEKQEYHLSINSHTAILIDEIERATGKSRGYCKTILNKGAVWLERNRSIRRVRKAKTQLKASDKIHIYHSPSILEQHTATAKLVSDEGIFSVWYKPKGMFSQGSKWGDHCTLYRWAETHLKPQRNAFIVHRLDRATDGLMVVAHTKKCAAQLSLQFEKRLTEKHYQAVISGLFPDSFIVLDNDIEGKATITEVSLIETDPANNQSIVHINLKTGRKHQIRKHLSEYGYPIIGDRLYGNKDSTADLQLSSIYLSFNHPETNARMEYRS